MALILWFAGLYMVSMLTSIGINTLWAARFETKGIRMKSQDIIIMRNNLDYTRTLLLQLERNARSESYRRYIKIHLAKNDNIRNILDKNIK